MFSKQIAYVLFSVIALLLVLFGYSIYSNYTNKLESEKKISAVISKFEEKFKSDSIYLANENKMLIDRISQHIIDSVSKAYEEKLKKAILETNKYKQLLLDNNIKVKKEDLITPKNTHLSNLNITTYSKSNKNNKTKKSFKNHLNITTVSELKKHKNTNYNNVTVYTKKETKKEIPSHVENYNITTYSKLNNSNLPKKNTLIKKYNSVNSKKTKTEINLTHNNYILDHSANLNDLDMVPIYQGCANYKTEDELKNCFAINISKHIFKKFNSLQINNSGLKKGIHKVRVLFIIDKKGKAKIGKLVGKWPPQIYSNVKYAIETIPQMKPGYSNNKAVPVKYSLLIPFIIK